MSTPSSSSPAPVSQSGAPQSSSVAEGASAPAAAPASASASASPSPFDSAYHRSRAAEAAELLSQYPTLRLPPMSAYALCLHARLRDARTRTTPFVAAADQLLLRLIEHALSELPMKPKTVMTPTGVEFEGCEPEREVVGVSIVRAGEAMEPALRVLLPGARIGKILIQRDESQSSKPALFFYSKLVPRMAECDVLLLDPMLASGGSAICAVQHLLDRGVPLSQISFVCLIAAPAGIRALLGAFPALRIVAGCLDHSLDQHKYIRPGVGDLGDRYYGTVVPQEDKQ